MQAIRDIAFMDQDFSVGETTARTKDSAQLRSVKGLPITPKLESPTGYLSTEALKGQNKKAVRRR
jgi:hypothetical protein